MYTNDWYTQITSEHVAIRATKSLPGKYSEQEPPDPISNSEVKLFSADDSVGIPHVKVGNRQACK